MRLKLIDHDGELCALVRDIVNMRNGNVYEVGEIFKLLEKRLDEYEDQKEKEAK